jgi:hypothetical protein
MVAIKFDKLYLLIKQCPLVVRLNPNIMLIIRNALGKLDT